MIYKIYHLPQVYDFLEVGQDVYTIMDYMKQLCEVLEYLHSQKPPIYHSDIKPEYWV